MLTFKRFLLEDETPPFKPSLAEGRYRVGGVIFDAAHGLGAVPFNQSVYYHGFVVEMEPSDFLRLALPDDDTEHGSKLLAKIQDGAALGPPFLDVVIPGDRGGLVQVVGHEGRGRVAAFRQLEGNRPLPVHVLLMGGMRNRNLGEEAVEKINGFWLSQDRYDRIWRPFSALHLRP